MSAGTVALFVVGAVLMYGAAWGATWWAQGWLERKFNSLDDPPS